MSGGLAEQTNDEELTDLLKAVEVEAGAKKEAQDEAKPTGTTCFSSVLQFFAY